MTGLSILYAKEEKDDGEWAQIPDRDKISRLREVYWAKKAESQPGRKSFMEMSLTWRPERFKLGRKADLPGDGFYFKAVKYPKYEDLFEWIEVTEVFTTVPAIQVNDAMKALNEMPNKRHMDIDEFRTSLNKRRPSRAAQRKAADDTIRQIRRKLGNSSYDELMTKYGYGTLVVGLPLWFATYPDDPWRVRNVLDDFYTRTLLGLEELTRRTLRKRDCPFRQILVVWDTSPEALQEWDEKKSSEYENAPYTNLENPVSVAKLGAILSQTLNKAAPDLGLEESDMPSFSLKIEVQTRKKKRGEGPYPELVTLMRKVASESKNKPYEIIDKLKLWFVQTLCQLLCFMRVHGFGDLEMRIMRKISVPRAWKVWATRQRARSLYMESSRRNKVRGTQPDV